MGEIDREIQKLFPRNYNQGNSMTENEYKTQYQSECPTLRKIRVSQDCFEVYEVTANLFAFCETRHYENTTISLIIGPQKAVLIDTGCGIGDLRAAVWTHLEGGSLKDLQRATGDSWVTSTILMT